MISIKRRGGKKRFWQKKSQRPKAKPPKKKEIEDFVKSRPPYFWWLLANLLALAFAIASWSTCYYLFNNPHLPENYETLTKLKRLDPPKNFTPFTAPGGVADPPATLYGKYIELPQKKLNALNKTRMQNYLRNFKQSEYTTYAEGTYRITHIRPLNEKDFVTQGVVIRARAFVQEDDYEDPTPYPLVIEYILPTQVTDAEQIFLVGDELRLKRLPQCPFILNTSRLDLPDEPTVCVTIIPLCYGNTSLVAGSQKTLKLSPPDKLNLYSRFPLMTENRALIENE